MNNNENAIEYSIDLKELFNLFVKRLPVLILAAAVAVGVFFAYDTFTYVPEYESTAVLYVLKQNADGSEASSSEFNMAINVTTDCTLLLKSHSVLEAVISELNLDTSYSKLNKSVTTSNPTNSRVLNVAVRSDSPENAKRIVDKVCEIGVEQIEEAMGFKQVNFYEHGTLTTTPCNRTSLMVYFAIGIAAAALVYLVFAAKLIFDDRIDSDEDIEKYLEIAVIGIIPDANATSGKKYGRYGRYGKYGKYGNEPDSSKE
jgi:capsular polysaccharide biosynthesis protein